MNTLESPRRRLPRPIGPRGPLSILALSLLMLPSTTLAATPVVSGVAGAVSTGQTLAITGSNMVDEDKTNWDSWYGQHPNASGFEGTDPQSDGYWYADNGCQEYLPTYVTDVKLMGNQSLYSHVMGSDSGGVITCAGGGTAAYCPCSGGGTYGRDTSYVYWGPNAFKGVSGDFWLRWYDRYHLNSGQWPYYLKDILTLGGSQALYFDSSPWGGVPANPYPTVFTTKLDPYSIRFPPSPNLLPDGLVRDNVWYCVEIHINNALPLEEIYVNNVQVFRSTVTQVAGITPTVLLSGIVNYSDTDPAFNLDHWQDGFAVSSARIYPAAMVEIGNSATYGQGSEKRQDPVYLSDGSVQVAANLNGLGTGPYYLWVTNNMRQRSAPFLLGGSSSAAAPAAPRGLVLR